MSALPSLPCDGRLTLRPSNSFCMNLISLQPGESIYVGADGVHAWLDGREYLMTISESAGQLTRFFH